MQKAHNIRIDDSFSLFLFSGFVLHLHIFQMQHFQVVHYKLLARAFASTIGHNKTSFVCSVIIPEHSATQSGNCIRMFDFAFIRHRRQQSRSTPSFHTCNGNSIFTQITLIKMHIKYYSLVRGNFKLFSRVFLSFCLVFLFLQFRYIIPCTAFMHLIDFKQSMDELDGLNLFDVSECGVNCERHDDTHRIK